MPRVRCGALKLFYEEAGSGPPLVLICGLGFWRWQWFKQGPFFSQFFRTITFDSRGVGDSDRPQEPYTTADLAADVAGLVEGLGLGPSHILGYSLGGTIAMELAARRPELVRSLVLVSTHSGGEQHIPADPEAHARLAPDPALDHRANMGRSMAVVAAPGYWDANPAEMAQVLDVRLSKPTPYWSFNLQLQAARAWPGIGQRLQDLAAPALIVHGDADQLVPVANASSLAALLPGAQVLLIPGAGHLPFIEAAPMFNRVVARFLQSV